MPTFTENFNDNVKYVSGGVTGLTQMDIDAGLLKLQYNTGGSVWYESGNAITKQNLADTTGTISLVIFTPSGLVNPWSVKFAENWSGSDVPVAATGGWKSQSPSGLTPEFGVINNYVTTGSSGLSLSNISPLNTPAEANEPSSINIGPSYATSGYDANGLFIQLYPFKGATFDSSGEWSLLSSDVTNYGATIVNDTGDKTQGTASLRLQTTGNVSNSTGYVSLTMNAPCLITRSAQLNVDIKNPSLTRAQTVKIYKKSSLTSTGGTLLSTFTVPAGGVTPPWVNRSFSMGSQSITTGNMFLEFRVNPSGTDDIVDLKFDNMTNVLSLTSDCHIGAVVSQFVQLNAPHKSIKLVASASGVNAPSGYDYSMSYEMRETGSDTGTGTTTLIAATNTSGNNFLITHNIYPENYTIHGSPSQYEKYPFHFMVFAKLPSATVNPDQSFVWRLKSLGESVPWYGHAQENPSENDFTTSVFGSTSSRTSWRVSGNYVTPSTGLGLVVSGMDDWKELTLPNAFAESSTPLTVQTKRARPETIKLANGKFAHIYKYRYNALSDLDYKFVYKNSTGTPFDLTSSTGTSYYLAVGLDKNGYPSYVRDVTTSGTGSLILYSLGSQNPQNTGSVTSSTLLSTSGVTQAIHGGIVASGLNNTHILTFSETAETQSYGKLRYFVGNPGSWTGYTIGTVPSMNYNLTVVPGTDVAWIASITGASGTTGPLRSWKFDPNAGAGLDLTLIDNSVTQHVNYNEGAKSIFASKLDSLNQPVVLAINTGTRALHMRRNEGGVWVGGATNLVFPAGVNKTPAWVNFAINNDSIVGVAHGLIDHELGSLRSRNGSDDTAIAPIYVFSGTVGSTGSFVLLSSGAEFVQTASTNGSFPHGVQFGPEKSYVYFDDSKVWWNDNFESGLSTDYAGNGGTITLSTEQSYSTNSSIKVVGTASGHGFNLPWNKVVKKDNNTYCNVTAVVKCIAGKMVVRNVTLNNEVKFVDSAITDEWCHVLFIRQKVDNPSYRLEFYAHDGPATFYVDNINIHLDPEDNAIPASGNKFSYSPRIGEWKFFLPQFQAIKTGTSINDYATMSIERFEAYSLHTNIGNNFIVRKSNDGAGAQYLTFNNNIVQRTTTGWDSINLRPGTSVWFPPSLVDADLQILPTVNYFVSRNNKHFYKVSSGASFLFNSSNEDSDVADFIDTGATVDSGKQTLRSRIEFIA